MFSSSGYFRGVTCPYFASGLCERPYCHFRHVKPTVKGHVRSASYSDPNVTHASEDGAADASVSSRTPQSSSLLSMVGQAIKQVQRDIERDKATLTNIRAAPAAASSAPADPGSCIYKPTPIVSRPSGGGDGSSTTALPSAPASSGLYAQRTTVPQYQPTKATPAAAQYNPTPISVLKQKKSTQKRSPGRYVLDPTETVAENEYDPAVNFATGSQGKAKKRSSSDSHEDLPGKKPRLQVEANGETETLPEAVFSEEESEGVELADVEMVPQNVTDKESQSNVNKATGKVQMENKGGVFTMDVNAILGLEKSSGKSDKTSKTETKLMKGHKTDTEKVKGTHSEKGDSQKRNTTHNTTSKKAKPEKTDSCAKGVQEVAVKQEKHDSGRGERNIFHLIGKTTDTNLFKGGDMICTPKKTVEEIVNTSGPDNQQNIVSVKKEKEDNSSNKENNKSHKSIRDKSDSRDRTTSGSSSGSSDRHRSHSHNKDSKKTHHSSSSHKPESKSGEKHKDKNSKEQTSKPSSNPDKSDSHREDKHKSLVNKASSASSKTSSSSSSHRSSSSRSASSNKHKSSSSSAHHHKSHKSSHSSSKSSHSSSSSRSKERLPSTGDHLSIEGSSRSSKLKNTGVKSTGSKAKGPRPITERSISHVDLFGEDSDESDSDVKIVEAPKESINVIELSSEEDSAEPVDKLKDENDSKREQSSEESEVDDCLSVSGAEDGFSTADLNLDQLEQSLEEEDTFDECLRIFNEQKSLPKKKDDAIQKAKISQKKEEKEENDEGVAAGGKARIARLCSREAGRSRVPPAKSAARPSPSEVMHNRFLAIQKAAEKAAEKAKASTVDSAVSGKQRVAHSAKVDESGSRPGSSLLLNKRSRPPLPTLSQAKTPQILVGTNPKGAKRAAHMPAVRKAKRPTIPTEYGSKVPSNIRQRYLNQFIDECLKIYSNEEDSFERALSEEKVVYSRSSSRTVYLNVAVNCIKKLRSEIANANPQKNDTPTKNNPHTFSHEALLGGKMAATTHFTIKRSGGPPKQPIEVKGAELYLRLGQYVLTEEQLIENGFPRMSEENPGTAIIKSDGARKKMNKSSDANERFCVRCGQRFLVAANGNYVAMEECTHHWGKSWKRKIGNSIEYRFTCCQGDPSAPGCSVGKGHVHEQNKYENFKGYMQTMPASPPPDGNYGIYALDCEMVYTTAGLELARVTVVDSERKVVFEQTVKPSKPIIDPNTRFSGLTEEDFDGVTATIRDVQAVLLSLFNDSTILVGHSLESDLTALRLVHSTVVDTSVVFPHRLGPPYKRALRTLMVEILQKIIQNDVGGHDSQEDAVSALELMLWKVKEDVRRDKRR